jgi:hypothetical protein
MALQALKMLIAFFVNNYHKNQYTPGRTARHQSASSDKMKWS